MTYTTQPGSLPQYDAQVSEDAKNLAVFLDRVLQTVETRYAAYGMPIPTRRYWTTGQAAVDCEQLVVVFQQMYLGAPGAQTSQPERCNAPRTATLSISVAREVPSGGINGQAPAPHAMTRAARVCAYDAWILMESAADMDQWEEGGYGLGVVATVDTLQPEGGFQVVSLTVTVAIP